MDVRVYWYLKKFVPYFPLVMANDCAGRPAIHWSQSQTGKINETSFLVSGASAVGDHLQVAEHGNLHQWNKGTFDFADAGFRLIIHETKYASLERAS